ncbi:nitrate- and nitrite sensing domain-containing protein [Planomonospora venezuelensis]
MRSRLFALILVPTAAAIMISGLRIVSALDTAAEYRRLTQAAELVQSLGALAHELALERDRAAWYLAQPRSRRLLTAVTDQFPVTDEAARHTVQKITSLDGDQDRRIVDAAIQVRRWIVALDGETQILEDIDGTAPLSLRHQITGGAGVTRMTVRAAIRTYSRMIDDISAVRRKLADEITDDALAAQVSALTNLTDAAEEASRQRAIVAGALVTGSMEYDDLTDFLASLSRGQTARADFQSQVPQGVLQFSTATLNDPEVSQKINRTGTTLTLVQQRLRENGTLRDLDRNPAVDDAGTWFESATAYVDALRTVGKRLESEVVTTSRDLSSAERTTAVTLGLSLLALLGVVLAVTLVIAWTIVTPLRRLRREALEIAGSRLPDLVRLVRTSDGSGVTPEIIPIDVTSRDEVGEVARAFDEVHREAVRLAADEAVLRNNINAMFVNLSRRIQTLVGRQLALIESLEKTEEDADRLGDLFRLDHMATRMRRSSENLLVLAGQEPARRMRRPVPLIDVIRAALAEVENYERVELRADPGVSISGAAANDMVHLLAELIENAISFSPNTTKVSVRGDLVHGAGAMISVGDRGIGLIPEELARLNERLADPPAADVEVSRRMGLFVVGRLALRHGVRVRLRGQDGGGLTAMVMLPDDVLAGGGARQQAFGPSPAPQRPPAPPDVPATMGGPSFEAALYAPGPVVPAPSVSTGGPGTGDDFLPIFESVGSDWFHSAVPPQSPGEPPRPETVRGRFAEFQRGVRRGRTEPGGRDRDRGHP